MNSQEHHIKNPKNTKFENKGNCLEKGQERNEQHKIKITKLEIISSLWACRR